MNKYGGVRDYILCKECYRVIAIFHQNLKPIANGMLCPKCGNIMGNTILDRVKVEELIKKKKINSKALSGHVA